MQKNVSLYWIHSIFQINLVRNKRICFDYIFERFLNYHRFIILTCNQHELSYKFYASSSSYSILLIQKFNEKSTHWHELDFKCLFIISILPNFLISKLTNTPPIMALPQIFCILFSIQRNAK